MTDAAAPSDRAGIEGRVLAVVASITGPRAVDTSASWRSMGMDSLDLLSLVTSIEDEFDVRIPDQAAMRLQTVADVVALLSPTS
ncbi:MAG: phosphopantetheine-binding protein [Acidimicrobiales bacterium]